MEEILELFGRAGREVGLGNWTAVFGLLDDASLQAVGKNSLVWLLLQDVSVWRRFPDLIPMLEELQRHSERLTISAQLLQEAPLQNQASLSLAHRDLVRQQAALLKESVKGRGALLGAVESFRRASGLGGSLSSQLFQGERLDSIQVEGRRAVATRIFSNGESERLFFVRTAQGWKIQLMKRG